MYGGSRHRLHPARCVPLGGYVQPQQRDLLQPDPARRNNLQRGRLPDDIHRTARRFLFVGIVPDPRHPIVRWALRGRSVHERLLPR